MKKTLFVAFFLLFLTASNVFSQTPRPADSDDNQIWHETVVGVPLTKKTTLNFNGVLRYSADQKLFADKRIGFGLAHRLNKNVTIGGTYLYRVTQPLQDRFNYENRFIANLTLSKTFGKTGLSNRNQYEYQARNSRTDKWVYRNRTQIDREIKINDFEFKPFASVEPFYDSQFKKFYRVRIAGGVSKKLAKSVTLDAYYLRQIDKRSRPGDLNVFGTTLRINFDFFGINN